MNLPYAAIMTLAVATGVVLSRRYQRPLGLSLAERVAIGLGAFCGAMIGAKAPFLLADSTRLFSGVAWLSDGKTIMLGLVGGYLGVELAKWAMEIHVKTGDSFAVPAAAAVAVGRLACFAAGCCYGTPTSLPWGVRFEDGVLRHPTQLYESIFHATAAILLAWLWSRGTLRGHLIKLYILAYLGYRFATEFIRPEPQIWLSLTGYQWAALLLVPLFTYLWLRDSRSPASTALE